jgi:hypothetical protein
MAKGDKGDVQAEINAEQQRVQDQYNAFNQEQTQIRNEYRERSDAERDFLTSTLQNQASSGTGGLNQDVINNIRNLYGGSAGGSGGGGGGVSYNGPSPSEAGNYLNEIEGMWRNFANTGGVDYDALIREIPTLQQYGLTGGYDGDPYSKEREAGIMDTVNRLKNFEAISPEDRARIMGGIDSLYNLGQTGGIDPNGDAFNTYRKLANYETPDDLKAIWMNLALTGGLDPNSEAMAGYRNYAQTGGWSPEQRAEFRNRATSVIPAMYQQGRNDLATNTALTGGYNPALAASLAKMNRQGAQELATAARNAEVDLGSQIREGEKWGIAGLGDMEKAAMQGKQYGATGLSGLESQRLSAIEKGAQGLSELERAVATNKINANELAVSLQTNFQKTINDAMLEALTSAGSLEKGLGDAMAAAEKARADNRIAATKIASDAQAQAEKLRQEGMLAGIQGLQTVAQQKEAAARAAEAAARSAAESSAANDRWWANFIASNERWMGETMMSGQSDALRNLTQIYGMDPTLARDNLGLNIINSNANANSDLLRTDAQLAAGNKGNSALDWAKLGLGALSGLGSPDNRDDRGGGGSDGRSTGGVSSSELGFTNPNYGLDGATIDNIGGAIDTGPGSSIWNVPSGPDNGTNRPSEDTWWWGY